MRPYYLSRFRVPAAAAVAPSVYDASLLRTGWSRKGHRSFSLKSLWLRTTYSHWFCMSKICSKCWGRARTCHGYASAGSAISGQQQVLCSGYLQAWEPCSRCSSGTWWHVDATIGMPYI